MRVARWLGPAALNAGAGLLLLWLIRPSWYLCADGVNADGEFVDACFDGRTDGPVLLFAILLMLELVAVVVLAAVLQHERRRDILRILLGVQVLTVIAGVIVCLSGLWPDAIPDPLPLY